MTTLTDAGPARTTTAGLVACDIDRTLLITGKQPSRAVVRALASLRSAGHHVVLSTGRSLVGALSAAKQLRIREGYVVASNGAVVAMLEDGRGRVLWKHQAPAEQVLRHVAGLIAAGRLRAAAEITGHGYLVTSPFPQHELPGVQERSTLEALLATPTPRLALLGQGARRLAQELRALGVSADTPVRPDDTDDWVDVTAPNLSKATALEEIRQRLGVDPRRTAAVGDGENDFEMFTWAGSAYVMDNATAELRERVLALGGRRTGSVFDDGGAHALADIEKRLHEPAAESQDQGRRRQGTGARTA